MRLRDSLAGFGLVFLATAVAGVACGSASSAASGSARAASSSLNPGEKREDLGRGNSEERMPDRDPIHRRGRLRARPHPAPAAERGAPGERRLGLANGRDALLRVPDGLRPGDAVPLVVMLHGAGANARNALRILGGGGFEKALVLAPESRGRTWDGLTGEFGPDVAFMDEALEYVFARHRVDPARIAIAGFSDGASYALSIGIANGDLFRHVIAFSPGLVAPPAVEGGARIWISHGTYDPVLEIQRTSRRIVPRLKEAGFDVTYREFEGVHEVPDPIVFEAWSWLTRR